MLHFTDGPYGAKGLSEHPNYVGAAAIVNAISNALGRELDSFPLAPDKLYACLQQQAAGRRKA